MRTTALLMIMLPLSLTALAQSQDGQTKRPIKYAERTEIEFDKIDVKGELTGPDGIIASERVAAEFESFISLRSNFNAEMAESVDAVK